MKKKSLGIQLRLLTDLSQDYADYDLHRLSGQLLIEKDDEKQTLGILLRSAGFYREQKYALALQQLADIRRLIGFYPLSIMVNIVWLAQEIRQEQFAAHQCLQFASDTVAMGYPDLGLEACTAAYILDGLSNFEITKDPEQLKKTGLFFQQALKNQPIERIERSYTKKSAPRNVAIIVPNLVDHIVAYTRRILQFARYLNPEKYHLRIYVTENLSQRTAPGFPYGCIEGESRISGAATLAALKQIGWPVFILDRDLPFLKAGNKLARQLERDEIDMAIFQSGMACPIDWIAMRTSNIPVKAGIHIGTSYYGSALDMVFFDNPQNIQRESNWDEKADGKRIVLPKGTDIDLLDAQKAIGRERLHIPEDAVIVGTLSNHLDQRLSAEYMDVVSEIMKENVKVWFVPIGANTIQEKMIHFQQYGVAGRVRFAGRQQQIGSALKLLDIYASEFPVGGAQSVMEAMACRIPVVALRWSNAHAESAAAEVAGLPYGILSRDLSAYKNMLNHLIRNPAARKEAGESMRLRAEERFSAGNYIQMLMQHLETIYQKKNRTYRKSMTAPRGALVS